MLQQNQHESERQIRKCRIYPRLRSQANTTQRAEKLTQAILAKAFRGELVTIEAELAHFAGQSSKPASTLLNRIKSECENIHCILGIKLTKNLK